MIIIYPSGIMGPDDWTESINLNSYKVRLEKGFPKSKGFSGSYVDVRDLADDTVGVIEEVLGSAKSFPLPRQLFWVWGKVGDLAKRFGKDLVVTSDGYKFMFNEAGHAKAADLGGLLDT